jgi:hypothetical protein
MNRTPLARRARICTTGCRATLSGALVVPSMSKKKDPANHWPSSVAIEQIEPKSGYYPFTQAALWIATKGGQARFKLNDRGAWKAGYDELLKRVVSDDVEVIGRRNEEGLNEKIPGFVFAEVQISLPFEDTPDRILFGNYPYIRCYGPVSSDHWQRDDGFDDRIFPGGRARKSEWSHLQVNAAHLAKFWSFQEPISASVPDDGKAKSHSEVNPIPGAGNEDPSTTADQAPKDIAITIDNFIEEYIDQTKAKGGTPTQKGLVEVARPAGIMEALRRARKKGRNFLRVAFKEKLGPSAPARGRPSKDNSPK